MVVVVVVEVIFEVKLNTIGVINSSCVKCGFDMMVP
jgi:exosome complex RNA-binding protein Csl4